MTLLVVAILPHLPLYLIEYLCLLILSELCIRFAVFVMCMLIMHRVDHDFK